MMSLKELIEINFQCVSLDNELSVIELDLLDSNASVDCYHSGIDAWWDEDSKRFLHDFKTAPVEKFSSWKNLTIEYMDSHAFIFSSLSKKAYVYYLAFFLWSYTFNSEDLFNSNFSLLWIYTLNPFLEETYSYDRAKIQKFQNLTKGQFELTRIVIHKMINDINIHSPEKMLLEDASNCFWYSVNYEDLESYK